jgi:hypothetical protein
MAYDEGLAERVREALDGLQAPELVEKQMFGGIGFLVQGNMACGVHGEGLIVRVGPEWYDEALAEADTGPFDMTGRPMRGWVVVAPEGTASDRQLGSWVRRGVDFACTLPPK